MAHQAAQLGPAVICQLASNGLLVVGFPQADLHELVVEQGTVERPEHTRADPALPHVDERLSRVCKSAQKTTLKAFECGHEGSSEQSGPLT